MQPEDGFAVRYRPPASPPRKEVFEPHSDGGYQRQTYTWTGCRWRLEGEEYVDDVEIEGVGRAVP